MTYPTGMTKRLASAAVIALLVPCTGLPDTGDDPVELVRNPFARPAAALGANSFSGFGGGALQNNRPLLRAILLSGPKSVVDLDGVILKIGERSGDYELVAVGDHKAVFRKDGQEVTLWLFEDDQDDGDDQDD